MNIFLLICVIAFWASLLFYGLTLTGRENSDIALFFTFINIATFIPMLIAVFAKMGLN